MALDPAAFQQMLPSLVEVAAASFYLPGGHAWQRPLCMALEVYGGSGEWQGMLVGAVAALLGGQGGQQLMKLGGGDAEPQVAQVWRWRAGGLGG
jgi:hypothetical protein